MRFATSFFSPTLYKKHLQRYWPIGVVWLLGWTLAVPVQIWVQRMDRKYLQARVGVYQEMLPASAVVIALAAALVAAAVLFHLFKSPATNFIAALPIRREGVFLTAFGAGYTLLVVPLIIVSLITTLLECAMGLFHPSIWLWLGGCALLSFFWLSFAFLCCVITGNGVAGMAFYAIFNSVVVVMASLVEAVLREFLYGFSGLGDGAMNVVSWFTPMERLLQYYDFTRGAGEFWYMLWVYAGTGFLMFLAALGLHHIRKSERAGDLIAFAPLRYVFKVCVTVCGGLSLGLLFSLLIRDGRMGNGVFLAGCCAVAAAISYIVAEMLLQKTLKVFKKSGKWAMLAAAVFAAVVLAVDMDVIGFSTRIPDPGQVRGAVAQYYGDVGQVAQGSDGLRYTAQNAEELVALHRYLVEHRDTPELNTGNCYARVRLAYDLGWRTVRREYSFHYSSQTEGQARLLLRSALAAGDPWFDVTRGKPSDAYLGAYSEDGDFWSVDLDGATRDAVWDAVVQDVNEGNYRSDLDSGVDSDSKDRARPEFSWYPGGRGQVVRQTFYLGETTVHTNQALEESGALERLQMEARDIPMTAETVD